MRFENRAFWILLLIYSVFLIFGLGSFPLIDWDENIYGSASKSMFQTGDYFRIKVNQQAFTEKPPFYFWLTSIFYHIFGIGEFATRMPSVLSGILSFIAIYFFGKKVLSEKFGLAWALLYSSSLLPLILSRTAYIDHLFNTLIFFSVVCIYLYDVEAELKNRTRFLYLILGAFVMGLATLTKGPLGIGVPVLSFIAMRILQKKYSISVWETAIAGFVCVLTIASYYFTDYLLHGDEFIIGFLEFQKKLLTKSLESHTGPWFYHFLVALVGFFPWTPFIFGYSLKENRDLSENDKLKGLFLFFLSWTILVLVIFSIVQTKLPHYSSSIYFPLSFFAAYLFSEQKNIRTSIKILFYTFGFSFFVLFISLPWILKFTLQSSDFIQAFGGGHSFEIDALSFLPAFIFILGFIASAFILHQIPFSSKFVSSLIPLWLSMIGFVISLSLFIAPKVIETLQGRILRLSDIAWKEKGDLVFYKYLSFYPFFYRDKPIFIIGSYKFRDDESLLTNSRTQKTFLLTNKNSILELSFLYPKIRVELVASEGNLVLLKVIYL
ncbi:ArnT family glycosyltransferase [Leptospira stimsonii]|uniref:Glycosyl transferase n=1 Tax=Leptospira stimsonii TaxID=2202203 RepID=A0A8B3CVH3_9LEPT|nr:glycosyltransferase family 39 protein [Leptospira stimsonii]RHX88685.1 glycosyl transferase [Leptospira stimsonii]